jgi:thiamine-monophosphate kinase
MAGEFDFINWIRAQSLKSDNLLVPPGDDLAVVKWKFDDLLLVGVDQVLDGVHFDSSIHTPRQIGKKVMNRNLSDCAAMACLPAYALATVALPRGRNIDYAKELYLGLREAGDAFDCPVIGGDTGSWDGKLVVTVTILGRSAGVKPITRAGAKVGDGIYVSGPLGGSILGRHLIFEPRVVLAREISARVSAMIDLSDGLSRDLLHICRESGVGAIIYADAIPVHEDAMALSQQDQRPPILHALHDGEDYELLYTASPTDNLPGTRIGTINAASEGILLQSEWHREPLDPLGWEHPL